MVKLIKRFVLALVFDEAAAQRWLVGLLYIAGEMLQSGGVIPGTTTVLPIDVSAWAEWGPVLKLAALYLAAGGALPALRRNGHGNGTAGPPPAGAPPKP